MAEAPTEYLNAEETAAFKTLAKRNRLMAVIVPENVDDEFCMRLSAFVSFLLDVQMLPALPIPAIQAGDGLSCPYCHVRVSANPASYSDHSPDCDFRKAIERWAMAQIQIDGETQA